MKLLARRLAICASGLVAGLVLGGLPPDGPTAWLAPRNATTTARIGNLQIISIETWQVQRAGQRVEAFSKVGEGKLTFGPAADASRAMPQLEAFLASGDAVAELLNGLVGSYIRVVPGRDRHQVAVTGYLRCRSVLVPFSGTLRNDYRMRSQMHSLLQGVREIV